MATKAGKNTGTQRLLQKLEKSIEDGEYYEAHQLIRTLYFRFVFITLLQSTVRPKNHKD